MGDQGVALVTGAGGGLGRAIAIELDRRGYEVVAAMRDTADGKGLAPAIEVRRLDVTDPDTIEIPPGLTVLVNGEGADCEHTSIEDTSLESWRTVFETNVFGLVSVTRAAIPELRASGNGVVVNLTSASVVVPTPFFAVHRASKAAVSALGETLRGELVDHGIRVVEVLPGAIDTHPLAESEIVPEAVATPPYQDLADRVAARRESLEGVRTPAWQAASTIADAIADPDAPHRLTCDPAAAGFLSGWDVTDSESWSRAFILAFAPVDPDPPSPDGSTMTPEETVNEFIRRVVAVDLDGACELVTADVEYDNVPMGKNSGPEGIKSFLGPMVDGIDEVQFVVHRQAATGNVVMNERTDRFRVGDNWIDLPVAGIFEVDDDGLITLWRDYFDLETLLKQMAAVAPTDG